MNNNEFKKTKNKYPRTAIAGGLTAIALIATLTTGIKNKDNIIPGLQAGSNQNNPPVSTTETLSIEEKNEILEKAFEIMNKNEPIEQKEFTKLCFQLQSNKKITNMQRAILTKHYSIFKTTLSKSGELTDDFWFIFDNLELIKEKLNELEEATGSNSTETQVPETSIETTAPSETTEQTIEETTNANNNNNEKNNVLPIALASTTLALGGITLFTYLYDKKLNKIRQAKANEEILLHEVDKQEIENDLYNDDEQTM